MDNWVYFAGLYGSKFEAYCAVMWIEADERIRGTTQPTEVQVYQTRHGKFGVRFRKAEEHALSQSVRTTY